MARILFLVLQFLAGSFIKSALLGAGLGLFSGAFVLTIITTYINSATASMSGFGSYAGLFGLCGFDKALSILIAAMVCKTTINTLTPKLMKI